MGIRDKWPVGCGEGALRCFDRESRSVGTWFGLRQPIFGAGGESCAAMVAEGNGGPILMLLGVSWYTLAKVRRIDLVTVNYSK